MSYTYKETILDNGLRICAEFSDHAATSSIGYFVKTGARDERSDLMGVSHFLEHMMFKGTNTLSAEEVDIAFDNLGAEHNAFTSSEMTAFWSAGMPEVLGDMNEIIANILRPALRQKDFDDEKKVILEEIAMYDDQPFWVLYENAMEEYYGSSSLGHRVLGTPNSINRMQRDELASYFYERYSADNTIVVMSGDINFDQVVEQIERLCGTWERTGATRDYKSIQRFQGKYQKKIPDLHQHYVFMMMPSAAFQDTRKYAVAALSSILGGGDGSRLHWALVDSGLAEAAAANADASDGFGEQMAWAVCSPENADEVAAAMQKEMEKLLTSLTEEDVSKVIAKAATGAAIASERTSGRMQRLGTMLTTSGEYLSLEKELQRIEQLTLKDLQEVGEAFPWKPEFIACTSHT